MLPLSAGEAAIINDVALNTALAKHYATVLISGLRAIKAATAEAAINGQLNQSAGAGGAPEDQQNWLKGDTNQATIEAEITAITEDQMALLNEFETAHRTDPATGKGLA